MKKGKDSNNTNTLFLLLLVGIVLCLGGYRIFSALCAVSDFWQVRNIALSVLCAVMLLGGFALAYRAFRRLRELRDGEQNGTRENGGENAE